MGGCCCCATPAPQGARRPRKRSTKASRMVQSATTEPLLRDHEREAVSNLLRYLEQDESSTPYQLLTADKLQSLCTLSFSDNVDLQRSAALCFSELSEKLLEPVSETLLEPLLHLLLSSDIDVQKASSLALSNMALHGPPENKNTIVHAGALRPLIVLLGSESLEVQCNACGCITTLATTEANKIEIVTQGAVRPLLRLTQSHDPRVQRNATGALLNLTHVESNRQHLVQSGALPVFIQLLESRDANVQFYCAAALSNLAVHEGTRMAMVDVEGGKVLTVLVDLLMHGEAKVQCQACLAIRNLASDEANQEHLVQLGGLQALIPLTRSRDSEAVTAAIAALRNLSIHKGNEIPILQSGVLEELKRLLSIQDMPEIQCHAAGTLRNLAAEDQNQAIVDAGCVTVLAEQLRDSKNVPERVLSEITAALAVLASNPAARRQIMELYDGNFYKILLMLTGSRYKEVQYNCAGVIGHLAISEEYHTLLLDGSPSAVDFLFRFTQSPDPSFVHLALWIIAQFSNGNPSTKAMLRRSVLMNKVSELKASKEDSVEVVQLAETAFDNLKDSPGETVP